MVFVGGAFGKCWDYEVGALMGLVSLWERPHRSLSPLPPCENTERKWQSMNQEMGSQQTQNLPAPWSWTSRPPEQWEVSVVCKPPTLSYPSIASQMGWNNLHGFKYSSIARALRWGIMTRVRAELWALTQQHKSTVVVQHETISPWDS